nr:uncharacterized protein LOC128703453 [Cherax quadricarinatus]
MAEIRKRWWVWLVEVIFLLVVATDLTCLMYGKYDLGQPLDDKQKDLSIVKVKNQFYKYLEDTNKFITVDNVIFGNELTTDETKEVKMSLKICTITLASVVTIWILSFVAPMLSFIFMQIWVLYAGFWADDYVEKAVVVLQYIQVRLPMYAFQSLEPDDMIWSEGLLFWWWEIKVTFIYAASTFSIYSYLRRSLHSCTPQDVEPGFTDVRTSPHDVEFGPTLNEVRTPLNTRAQRFLFILHRLFVAHLSMRGSTSMTTNYLAPQLPGQVAPQPSCGLLWQVLQSYASHARSQPPPARQALQV